MAYAVQVQRFSNPNGEVTIVVTETDAADTDEAGGAAVGDVIAVPKRFRLMGVLKRLVSGTGTLVSGTLGRRPGYVALTEDEVLGIPSAAPAAFYDVQPDPPILIDMLDQDRLFMRSEVNNAAADHVIRTEIKIKHGWEG